MINSNVYSEQYITDQFKHFMINNKYYLSQLIENLSEGNDLAKRALNKIIELEIKNITTAFVNNNHNFFYYEKYVYSSLNKFCNKLKNQFSKRAYVCPECKNCGEINYLLNRGKLLYCTICEKNNKKSFSLHSRVGFSCQFCSQFIPKSHTEISNVCPYSNCGMKIELQFLKLMKHPTANKKFENDRLYLQDDEFKIKCNIMKDELIEIIEEELKNINHIGIEYTRQHKKNVLLAYKNICNKNPELLKDYLLSPKNGCQHIIFQEYIKTTENNLPFKYKKYNKEIEINNINDLNIFDGISIFKSRVELNTIINNTQEYFNDKQYFIGKVKDILINNNSVMHHLLSHNFNSLKLNTNNFHNCFATVHHYRMIPHYQMGSMVYLNDVKKRLKNKCLELLNDK